jgi:hypothetical protein
MSEHADTYRIDGHVFDGDGNPIEANTVLRHLSVDGEPCVSLSGDDWFANRSSGPINRADDVQFCVPLTALPEPGVWTVMGIRENLSSYGAEHPHQQPRPWSEIVLAASAAEAIEKVRSRQAPSGTKNVIAGCVAGKVQVET